MPRRSTNPGERTKVSTDHKTMAVPVFGKPQALTDVTFVVEGRKLFFWKLFLRVASPVFERMFTSDFLEKDSREIPLPDKKFEDMDIFLRNMHPAHAWKPLEDDTIGILLRFSGEYQTAHIRQKCVHHIKQGMASLKQTLRSSYSVKPEMAKKTIFYLCLLEQYDLPELREELIGFAAKIPLKELERDEFHTRLSEASKSAILRERCLFLENGSRF